MVRHVVFALFACIALCGCGPSLEQKIVGKWKGAYEGGEKNSIAESMGSMFAGAVTLDLKEDKAFTMQALFVPVQGTWKVEGSKLLLQADSVMGFSGDGARKNDLSSFLIDPDGAALRAESASKDSAGQFVLRKEKDQ